MKVLSIFALVAVLVSPLRAQQRILVADASSSGTYKAMLSEIIEVCSDETFQIVELPGQTGGATNNLDALVNNRVSAAFLHSDVIYAAAQADPAYRQLKTLVALYPEEIHVVALRQSKTSGGFMRKAQFSTLADLEGFPVGAAGGGVITARILTGQGEGRFSVVPFGSGKEALAALDAGEVAAVVFVGGSPLPNIITLSGDQYKLLSIGESIATRLAGVYKSATVTYSNLNNGSAVKTLAASAIILTRRYTLPRMVAPQAKFRACFYSHLDELKETPGRHPKWQLVDPTDRGVWEWYEIPTTTAPRRP